MIEALVISTALLLLRTASFVAFARPWADRVVPPTVKIGLAVGLTVLWAPAHFSAGYAAAVDVLHCESSWLRLSWLAGREVLVGIGLGWLVSLMFTSLRVAGAYIAQEMGLTLGALASPTDQQPSSVVSQLLETVGTLLFFSVGAHHAVLRLFGRVLELAPIGGPQTLPHPGWLLSWIRLAERTGFELAAPIGVGLFLVTILLAVIMRLSPQFNLLTFGTSVRLLAGLGLLALLLPDVVNRILMELNRWTLQ